MVELGYPIQLVGCRTDPAVDGVGALFWLDDAPAVEPVDLAAGSIRWRHAPQHRGTAAAGVGLLAVPGWAPARVEWEEARLGVARCRPEVVRLTPADSFLEGIVSSPYRRGRALEVVGCGGLAQVVAEHRFRMAALADGPCTVWARPVSAPSALSAATEVVPVAGGAAAVSLSALPSRYSWLGLDVREVRGGVEVLGRTQPGLLEAGDRVVAIDGRRLRRRDDPVPALAAALLPRDGRDHELVVVRDGDRRRLRIALEPAPTP